MKILKRVGMFLRERQRWVLVALLAVLQLTLLAGAGTTVGLMCWLVDVGLFILWQPFIQTERRLDASSLILLLLLLGIGIWTFGNWLLILWVIVLASLLGGRVMMLGHRPTRIFYLLAFAYLLGVVLIWLVPRVVPNSALIGPSLDKPFAWAAPLIFAAMLLLPRSKEYRLARGGMVDFFYSLFIFLLVSVLVLGSLAFMLLRQSLYIEAVFRTLVSMALILLLIAWVWNPRPGFAGIGAFFSRYLLSIALPFETWLQRLMESAETENDADSFMQSACQGLLDLPWVVGGNWRPSEGQAAGSGRFGMESPFRQEFPGEPLVLTLFTQHRLSLSLIWHFHLLAQLACEYYAAKQRQQELAQVSYLRAVHETGSRLTHDVKNLLQSLNNLCFMAQNAAGDDAARFNALLQRQLPQITSRLQQTLGKLEAPVQKQTAMRSQKPLVPAEQWWELLKQRHGHDGIDFKPVTLEAPIQVSADFLDDVVENLLHNALIKRQFETGLAIGVMLSADAGTLRVTDNGSPVRTDLLRDLLRAPVASESGLGIGLYHAARQAENHGYTLRLASNEAGNVSFELRQNEQERSD